jgi:hypothetical protein
MYQKKWFSLIEIVIATSIITIAVFWVYKLIWENTKIINNSWNYLQVNSLFPVLEECIENIWFNTFIWAVWTEYNFNFWVNQNLDSCNITNWNKIVIDNLEYNLKWIIKNKSTDSILWELQIYSEETNTLTWNYQQLKK